MFRLLGGGDGECHAFPRCQRLRDGRFQPLSANRISRWRIDR
jgi:hypothetical protein